MSSASLLRGLFAAAYSAMFAWIVFSRHDGELKAETKDNRQRYLPYISGLFLPVFLLIVAAISIPMMGLKSAMKSIFSVCFGIFLHIGVYYLILLLFLPILRKHISSRACAALWIIPNYLYITQQRVMEISEPLVVLHVSGTILRLTVWGWIIGFMTVMLWKMAEHLLFRHHILKRARPVAEQQALEIWAAELARANIKNPKYKLLISPDVSTPLSIGFFKRTIRIVLPNRVYTQDELKLIFRHELVHICRDDASNKFFLVFNAAMCWFDPLMWIAMRKSADDLELSCDETVLLDADDDTRRKYSELLLRTVGDEKGFTTCLSASAKALRYRLSCVVKPRKLRSGAIVVGLTFFLLCMSCGYLALTYDLVPGSEVLFQTEENAVYTIRSVGYEEIEAFSLEECADASGLNAYLASLRCGKITGNYSFQNSDHLLTIIYEGPDGTFGVALRDRMLTVTPLHLDGRQAKYYVDSVIDWAYIRSLLS